MNKPFWVIAILLSLEIVAILLLIPGDYTDKAIRKEAVLIHQTLGAESQQLVMSKAETWYRALLMDSGFYKAMHKTLIPTPEERARSRGMENMGSDWFKWVETRIEAFASVVYQFCSRVAMFSLWTPYILILLLPALFDGAMMWKVKRSNFDYASSAANLYSVRAIVGLGLGLLIAFFLPISLNPLAVPAVMIACCLFIGLAISNYQKRV